VLLDPSWAGNAAIVSSWVFYVDALFKFSHPSGMSNWGIAMFGLWIPALINLTGVRQMAWFQNITVVLKFLPLLFVVSWAGSSSPRLISDHLMLRVAASTAYRHRRRRRALLLHWRRSGRHHRQACDQSSLKRDARLGHRHRRQCGLYVLVTAVVMGS